MLFTDTSFFLLVLVTFGLFYLPALRRLQSQVLIASSLVFYTVNCVQVGQAYYLLLLLASIIINAICSARAFSSSTLAGGRAWATAGVVANLLLLCSFKYAGLLGRSLPADWTGAGDPMHFLMLVVLPIGISFFSFEGITLVVDAFKARDQQSFFGNDPADRARHGLSTALFISFFPHLVSGPILKARDFFPQIVAKRLRDIDWEFCFRGLVTGYFLKMVVADNLKDHTFWMQHPFFLNDAGIELVLMLVGYSMQIFADFAGYSLIAVGLAGLFGYRLPENFDFPYISRSFSEFWRRWHISLSSWLREYLYFPLGGNRRGPRRTYLNLMIVMLLGGLWHGAAWRFAAWGGVHGLALAVERFIGSRVSVPRTGAIGALRLLGVFSIVTAAWLLFRLPEFGQAVAYAKAIITNWRDPPRLDRVFGLVVFCLPVIAYHALRLLMPTDAPGRIGWTRRSAILRPVMYGTMLFLLLVDRGTAGEFIYFQF
jgi:alginate O-acetyltransferase complex protein AlgI